MHGNSKQNPNLHHLYGIFEQVTEDVFKYGISDDPIDEDGLSNRARRQLFIFNLAAGFLKYYAVIMRKDIPGRAEAERIEREYINVHQEKYGHNPPGNLR
ncbi:MAG: hypothetical protein KA165_03740 [Saprospiraceae bacterium]|nr:hypothetical protein [Saprospiraceae bacterium]